jgi:hypothetical protein
MWENAKLRTRAITNGDVFRPKKRKDKDTFHSITFDEDHFYLQKEKPNVYSSSMRFQISSDVNANRVQPVIMQSSDPILGPTHKDVNCDTVASESSSTESRAAPPNSQPDERVPDSVLNMTMSRAMASPCSGEDVEANTEADTAKVSANTPQDIHTSAYHFGAGSRNEEEPSVSTPARQSSGDVLIHLDEDIARALQLDVISPDMEKAVNDADSLALALALACEEETFVSRNLSEVFIYC